MAPLSYYWIISFIYLVMKLPFIPIGEFYGLAGIDILVAWKKEVYKTTGTTPITETIREHDNALGFNIGAGSYMKITEQIDLYAEAKYVIYGKGKMFFSNYNQFMFNTGVLINLEWLWKNEKPGI